MTPLVRFLAVALFAAFFGLRASASTEAIIAQARAYLGPEAVLNAITSIHYTGVLESEEAVKDKAGKVTMQPFKATIEIIFQKPYCQRVMLVSYKGTEITALDDYEAWRRFQEAGGSARWSLTLLNKDQIKSQRASTWENLAFFRGIERRGGHVEDLGSVTIEGHACEKLAFVHEPGLTFYRYFDLTTGQLLLTELENGDRIREEGEVMINGVRFPRKLINIIKDRTTGKNNTATITLDKITLNEAFPDSLFAVPELSTQ
jgi:outer membrane lipoprotein-sorting protein